MEKALSPLLPSKSAGGLFLEPALIDVPFWSSRKIPVSLCNLIEHSVMLQPKCIIAQMCAVQHITSLGLEQSSSPQDKPDSVNLDFDLSGSPISEQDKERIINKLKSIPEVFAQDDSSYGHTSAVRHHIWLRDDAPFKERPRPIHPRDREVFRQHLKELLDAGIIKESESPFVSPVVLVRKKMDQSDYALIIGR